MLNTLAKVTSSGSAGFELRNSVTLNHSAALEWNGSNGKS